MMDSSELNFGTVYQRYWGNQDKKDDAETLQKVLQDIGLEEFIPSFQENLITLDQVKDLNSTDFEKLGVVAIGTRIKIKSAVAAYMKGSQGPSSATAKFMELQENRKRKKEKTLRNKYSVKCTRRVRIGWKHRLSGGTINKFKVMTVTCGGGMQLVDLNKDMTLAEAEKKIIDVFFPNGESIQFKLKDVDYYLATFANEKIYSTNTSTVGEYFESAVKSNPVRWYLHTILKEDNISQQESSGSSAVVAEDEDSDDLPSLEEMTATVSNDLQSPHTSTSAEHTFCDADTPTVSFRQRRSLSLNHRHSHRQVESVTLHQREVIEVIDSEDEELRMENVDPSYKEPDIQPEATSVHDVLKMFQLETVKEDTVTKILVQRSRILETALKGLDRKSINFKSKLYIKFSGEIGEDDGGPRRESFRLVMNALQQSSFFEGPETGMIFTHNLTLLEKDHYRLIGRLLALSLAQDGPGLHFLSSDLYDIMVGKSVHIKDADSTLSEDTRLMIKQLREANDSAKEDAFLMTFGDQLLDLGIPHVYRMARQEKEKLVELISKHYIYYRISAEISQFTRGMNDVNQAWNMVMANPELFKEIFCYKPNEITGDEMLRLFNVHYSEDGSNSRAVEDISIFGWESFLQSIEAGEIDVSFSDVLVFATGAERAPPCGFPKQVDVDFYTSEGRLPSASTCALHLWLPRVTEPDMIATMMRRAIKESCGFLKV